MSLSVVSVSLIVTYMHFFVYYKNVLIFGIMCASLYIFGLPFDIIKPVKFMVQLLSNTPNVQNNSFSGSTEYVARLDLD